MGGRSRLLRVRAGLRCTAVGAAVSATTKLDVVGTSSGWPNQTSSSRDVSSSGSVISSTSCAARSTTSSETSGGPTGRRRPKSYDTRWRGCSTRPVRSRPSAQNDRYVELSQGESRGTPAGSGQVRERAGPLGRLAVEPPFRRAGLGRTAMALDTSRRGGEHDADPGLSAGRAMLLGKGTLRRHDLPVGRTPARLRDHPFAAPHR